MSGLDIRHDRTNMYNNQPDSVYMHIKKVTGGNRKMEEFNFLSFLIFQSLLQLEIRCGIWQSVGKRNAGGF